MSDGRLESWKEIASHLGRSVRTVQRWEKHEGLPVHRHAHAKQGTVYGFKSEIDVWWKSRRVTLQLEKEPPPPAAFLVSRGGGWAIAGLFGVAFVLGALLWNSAPPDPPQILTPRPMTTLRGWKFFPTFAPDGKEVAFTWSIPGKPLDLYAKKIGDQGLRQVTSHPAVDLGAAWSPDGQWIAFLRGVRTAGPKRDLMIVPADGGAEVKLAETSPDWGPFITWTEDSQALIFSSCQAPKPCVLSLLDRETREQTALTFPPAGPGGDTAPALSADGKKLLFVRRRGGHTAQVHLQQMNAKWQPQGEPQPLTPDDVFATAPDWASNGRSFFYMTGEVGFSMRLWRQAAEAGAEPRLLATLGYGFFEPGIAVHGDRLATIDPRSDTNVRRVNVRDGEAAGPGTPLTTSTRVDEFPHISPDGKQFVFHSTRAGGSDLYVMETKGSNLMRLTSFGIERAREPRWSPDGSQIVFTAGAATGDIYVADAGGREPRVLVEGPYNDYLPSWSSVGDTVFFTSNRSGAPEVWSVGAAGGDPVRVTRSGGYRPIISSDGRLVYYTKREAGAQHGALLYCTPLDGGPEELVFDTPVFHPENFDVVDGRVYYSTAGAEPRDKVIRVFDPAAGTDHEVAQMGASPGKGLSVSRDGRVVVFSHTDYHDADLVLFEGL